MASFPAGIHPIPAFSVPVLSLALLLGIPGGASAQITERERQEVAGQIPGRDLSARPPAVASMFLFPLSPHSSGNARLEIRFGEDLPNRVKVILDDKVKVLRDDGQGEDWRAYDGIYCARVNATDKELRPIAAVSRSSDRFSDLVALSALDRGGVPVPQPPAQKSGDGSRTSFSETAFVAAAGPQVDPEKALLIRNTNVLNHYYRTTDPCKNVPTPSGQNAPPPNEARKWGFGYLMTQMANQSATGVSPSSFSLAWLDEWAKTQTINGDLLQEVDGAANGLPVAKVIKEQWLRRSGNTGRLNMGLAPFRLLAIVNRFDLRSNTLFGGGNAGELRFIFGVVSLDNREPNGQCASLFGTGGAQVNGNHSSNTTVILEYAVDKSSSQAIRAWADSWVNLNAKTQNSTDYRSALEAITESVVRAGVGNIKSRANGSALNVLRLNESNDNGVWDFREFSISKISRTLKARTIAQTPIHYLNNTEDLSMWADYHNQEIWEERHNPPLTFQEDPSSGSSFYTHTHFRAAHATSLQTPWMFNSGSESQFRFAKNTCNGCHKSENMGARNLVFHVFGRPFDTRAEISGFLSGKAEDGISPFFASDPRDGTQREFSELERRRQDLGNFISGSALSSLSFQPIGSVH